MGMTNVNDVKPDKMGSYDFKFAPMNENCLVSSAWAVAARSALLASTMIFLNL